VLVQWRIHYQAVRLLMKGLTFHGNTTEPTAASSCPIGFGHSNAHWLHLLYWLVGVVFVALWVVLPMATSALAWGGSAYYEEANSTAREL